MDIKILKIGLLATAAILAPVATMMIQYELQEDEEHEFEGDEIELANTETLILLPEKPQNLSKTTPPKAVTKKKVSTGRRGNRFRSLEDCLKVFDRCTSRSQKRTFNKSDLSRVKELIKGKKPYFSKR